MASKLFVGGLSWGTTDDKLRELFAQAGTVVSATVITDKYTGKSKGFGFVEMPSKDEGQSAIDGLNGKEFKGRTLNVNEARPRDDSRSSRGGQGGGYGGGRGGQGGGRGGQGGGGAGGGGQTGGRGGSSGGSSTGGGTR